MNNRVLIIASEFPPGPGGLGNQAYNIASYLKTHGYKLQVYTSSREKYDDTSFDKENASLNITRYNTHSPVKNIFKVFRYILQNRKNIDTVFLSGTSPVLLTLFIKKFCKWKTIAIIHGHEILMVSKKRKQTLIAALEKTDHIITVSDFAKDVLLKNTSLNAGKITAISNGIPLNRFQGLNGVNKKDTLGHKLKLVTVGSLTPRKGQHNVINALPALKEKWTDIEYHMVGIPQQGDKIIQMAERLGVQENIFIHGSLDDQGLHTVLSDADIFIMLSETATDGDVEGFGIAIIEGNLLGLPAIGSKGCGIERAISNEYSGVLVEPTNAQDVVTAVTKITERYKEYSDNAIVWANKHDWNILIKEYINIINS